MTPLLAGLVCGYGFVLGACLASFACVVAERLPAGVSLGGRSRCACGRQLAWYENVPVLGWLRVGGTARCCGARIPARYLVSELLLGGYVAAMSAALAAAVTSDTGGAWLYGWCIGSLVYGPAVTVAALRDRAGRLPSPGSTPAGAPAPALDPTAGPAADPGGSRA